MTTTSVGPEAERKAAAAAELVEQQQQQHFSDSGGVRAGVKLIFRPGGDTAVVGHKGSVAAAGWEGEERAFEANTGCVRSSASRLASVFRKTSDGSWVS